MSCVGARPATSVPVRAPPPANDPDTCPHTRTHEHIDASMHPWMFTHPRRRRERASTAPARHERDRELRVQRRAPAKSRRSRPTCASCGRRWPMVMTRRRSRPGCKRLGSRRIRLPPRPMLTGRVRTNCGRTRSRPRPRCQARTWQMLTGRCTCCACMHDHTE